jgi:XTP/dITP diphosphohydrolase
MENKVIVVASTNQGKIREFRQMLEPEGYTVKCLADFPDMPETEETGTTFAENAVIKAQAVTDRYHTEAVSDDSGLCIDAFGGEPGVHSARYLGHDTSYEYKNRVILEKMKDIADPEKRGCHYTCAIAVTRPGKEPVVFTEICSCQIAFKPRGNNGFGYDPIVYYPPLKKTMAEMDKDEKNAISHRGKAIRDLEKWLKHEEAD